MKQPRLRIVPCSIERAKSYVDALHRHHTPSTGARWAVACADEEGQVRGVAMIGRPVARLLDDGWTLEVSRVATDGCPNACSALYGAAKRIANAFGYSKLVTYTRVDEPGASLRGAGWDNDGEIRARSWDMPGRRRVDKTEVVRRQRWVTYPTGKESVELHWPHDDSSADQLELESEAAA